MTTGKRRQPPLWAALVVALALLAAAPSADALIIRAPRGRHVGILPRAAATATMRALAASAAKSDRHRRAKHAPARSGAHAWPTSAPLARAAVVAGSDPLVYHTGGSVLGTHRTYAIYWNPSGQPAFPAGYQNTINQYLSDVAADSGGHQNVYSVSAQYGANGQAGVYSSTYAGTLADVNPYPNDQQHGNGNGCAYATAKAGDPVYSYCLTDAQIQTELFRLIVQNGWGSGPGAVYFVFLPPGVDQCMGPGAESANNQCADQDYCAYHDATGAQPGPASDLYSVIPYADVSGCRSNQSPNGNGAHNPGDDAISIVSHEHNEAITDPLLNAWYDIHGNENGDKCEFDFGSALGGAALAHWNQLIAGHHYYLQQEWSNAASGCAQRDLLAQFAVTAANNGSSAGTYTFDASSSVPAGNIATYGWNFGDGSNASGTSSTATHTYPQAGVYTATLTVTDTAGNTSSATQQVVVANPGAAFTVSAPGYVGQAIAFDGSSSSAPGGTLSSWTWSFDDGSNPTTTSSATITHFFTNAGTYPVTLTVRDTSGNAASVTHQVVINAPIRQSNQPPASTTYGPGFTPATGNVTPAGVGLARVGNVQLLLSQGRLLLVTGRALTCLTATDRCTVAVTVTTREWATSAAGGHRRGMVRTVAIATATLTAAPGGRALIQLRLGGHGTALLRQLHRLAVSLDFRASAGPGHQLRQSLTSVLHLPQGPVARRRSARRA